MEDWSTLLAVQVSVGLALLLYAGGNVLSSFKVSTTEMRTVELQGNTFDLRAELLEESDGFLEIDDDNLRIENVKLDIKKSFDPSASLNMKHRARVLQVIQMLESVRMNSNTPSSK